MRSMARFGLFAVGVATIMAATLACSSEASDSPGSSASVVPRANADPVDKSLSPVKVGFHNNEGGAISLPDIRLGFEAGVEYVNSELGGINGHPMEAVYCNTDGTPDAALNCGNTFVQDKVVLSAQGLDFGGDGILPALRAANIAEFGALPLTPGLGSAIDDAAFGLASTEEAYAADVVQEHELGAKKLSLVFPDVPASRSSFERVVAPTAAKLGMQVSPYYYTPGGDSTTLAATVLAGSPDAVSLYATEADALAGVQALRGSGFTGTINATQSTAIVDKLDGATLENVIFQSNVYFPGLSDVPEKAVKDIAAFQTYIQGKGITKDLQAQQGFFVAVQSADILRQTPGDTITAAAVHESIKTAKGENFFTGGTYDCSRRTWPGSSACGTGVIFSKLNDDKVLQVLPNQPVDVSVVRPSS
ncbi:ABC transporter substrate-binding protein [Rhodococcus sp. KBS0724]|uniref:ABC transporter substrate-binding protein n=1 Tax=Rhodococcus sp. KBS0724 TaxID=1179674 RepID=UPI00163D891D|nr:ABC transporter substrate-binding protein [Rhodococcus sp. KBS0724]